MLDSQYKNCMTPQLSSRWPSFKESEVNKPVVS